MNELIVVDLPDSPLQFTYQGVLYEKIIEDYYTPNFEITVPETFSTIDEGLIYPVLLTDNNYISINNETIDDYTTLFVQTSGNISKITITDPFMDTSLIEVSSQIVSDQDISININSNTLETLYDTVYLRLKGMLYQVTHLGNHTQSNQGIVSDSVAFQIRPVTESLLKTKDYNLVTSLDGESYIDLISSTIS